MRRILLSCALVIVAIAPPTSADDADLDMVQGTWQRLAKDGEGRTIRIEKVHEGRTTRLTAYDEAGEVIYSHASRFELARTGKVRIFTYFDLVVTAGPNPGPTGDERHSYVYKVTSDQFVEVLGLLIGQEGQEPSMVIWERKRE